MIDEYNINTGTKAENFVTHEFAKKGIWATRLHAGNSGQQPFDVIAISQHFTYAIDVKHCNKDYFPFERIEENQKNALGYLTNDIASRNVFVGFVLVYENKPYWLSFYDYQELEKKGEKSVKPSTLKTLYELGDMRC